MELRDYIKIINYRKWYLLGFVVLSVFLGYLGIRNKPAVYTVNISFVSNYVDPQADQTGEFFRYNNYYGTLIAQSFNETISGVLKNTGIVQSVFQQAGLDWQTENIKNPGKFFRGLTKSRHVTEVSFSLPDEEKAMKLGNALIVVLNQKAEEFARSETEGSIYLGIEGPVVEQVKFSLAVLLFIIAVVGSGFGILIIFIWQYYQDETYSLSEIMQTLGLDTLGAVAAVHKNTNTQLSRDKQKDYDLVAEQLESILYQSKVQTIGVASLDDRYLNHFLARLNRVLTKQHQVKLQDVVREEFGKALDKIKNNQPKADEFRFVMLPELFGEYHRHELLAACDSLLILLPGAGLKRKKLKALKVLLDSQEMPKWLVFLR